MPGRTVRSLQNVVVFDLGGTWFRSGVWSAAGALFAQSRVPAVNHRRQPDASVQALQEGLVDYVCRESQRLVAEHGPIARAVVSMGAALDANTGFVFGSGPLWGARSQPLDLAAALRARAPSLDWHVLNDVTAALLRHAARFGERSVGRMALVTISSGIGCRAYDFARRCVPVDRVHGTQGEIGHLAVACTFHGRSVHLPCDCGGMDHLNAFASGRGLEALARHLAAAPHGGFSASVLARQGTADQFGIGEFLAAVAGGDEWSCSVLAAAIEPLADILCVMLTHDPELEPIVLVGGVAATLREALVSPLLDALDRRGMYEVTTRDPGWFRRRIELGMLDDDSGLIGCGMFVHAGRPEPES